MRLKSWISGTAIRDRVESLPETEEHREFARAFEPIAGADYEWFLSQSVKEFELTDKLAGELDSKADSLIGYLGAAEGVLALASVYIVNMKHHWFLLASIPAMLGFLLAILFAIVSRSPALHPIFPSTRDFLSNHPEGHYGKFAARIAATSCIARMATKEKARLVRWSYWSFTISLLWFVLAALAYSLIKIC